MSGEKLELRPERHGLPAWGECEDAVRDGTATALQRFIFHNEPLGFEDEDKFLRELAAMLEEADPEGHYKTRGRRVERKC